MKWKDRKNAQSPSANPNSWKERKINADLKTAHPDFSGPIDIFKRAGIKNLAEQSEAGYLKAIQAKYPGMDARLYNGQVVIKDEADGVYKALDPDTGAFSTDIIGDTLDIGGDLVQGAVETAGAVGGAIGGTLLAPGAGTLMGGMAGGAATGAATESVRQALGQYLGYKDDFDGTAVGINSAFGAAAPLFLGSGSAGKAGLKTLAKKGITKEGFNELGQGILSKVGKNTMAWTRGINTSELNNIANKIPLLEQLRKTPDGLTEYIQSKRQGFRDGFLDVKNKIGSQVGTIEDSIDGKINTKQTVDNFRTYVNTLKDRANRSQRPADFKKYEAAQDVFNDTFATVPQNKTGTRNIPKERWVPEDSGARSGLLNEPKVNQSSTPTIGSNLPATRKTSEIAPPNKGIELFEPEIGFNTKGSRPGVEDAYEVNPYDIRRMKKETYYEPQEYKYTTTKLPDELDVDLARSMKEDLQNLSKVAKTTGGVQSRTKDTMHMADRNLINKMEDARRNLGTAFETAIDQKSPYDLKNYTDAKSNYRVLNEYKDDILGSGLDGEIKFGNFVKKAASPRNSDLKYNLKKIDQASGSGFTSLIDDIGHNNLYNGGQSAGLFRDAINRGKDSARLSSLLTPLGVVAGSQAGEGWYGGVAGGAAGGGLGVALSSPKALRMYLKSGAGKKAVQEGLDKIVDRGARKGIYTQMLKYGLGDSE